MKSRMQTLGLADVGQRVSRKIADPLDLTSTTDAHSIRRRGILRWGVSQAKAVVP